MSEVASAKFQNIYFQLILTEIIPCASLLPQGHLIKISIVRGKQLFEETKPVTVTFLDGVIPLFRKRLNFIVFNYDSSKAYDFSLKLVQAQQGDENELGEASIDCNSYIDAFRAGSRGIFVQQFCLNNSSIINAEIYVSKSRYALERLVRQVNNPKSSLITQEKVYLFQKIRRPKLENEQKGKRQLSSGKLQEEQGIQESNMRVIKEGKQIQKQYFQTNNQAVLHGIDGKQIICSETNRTDNNELEVESKQIQRFGEVESASKDITEFQLKQVINQQLPVSLNFYQTSTINISNEYPAIQINHNQVTIQSCNDEKPYYELSLNNLEGERQLTNKRVKLKQTVENTSSGVEKVEQCTEKEKNEKISLSASKDHQQARQLRDFSFAFKIAFSCIILLFLLASNYLEQQNTTLAPERVGGVGEKTGEKKGRIRSKKQKRE